MFFKGGKGIFKKNFKKSECGMLKKLVQDYGVRCCFWGMINKFVLNVDKIVDK